MLVVLLSLAVIAAAAAADEETFPPFHRISPNFNVFEGQVAGKDEFPPIVSLSNFYPRAEVESQLRLSIKGDGFKHLCSGIIVHRQWVLTAAHCLKDYTTEEEFSNIRVRVGFAELEIGKSLESGEDNFEVEKVLVHPEFNKKFQFGDNVAVVKIKGSFKGGDRLATLDSSDEERKGEATAVGWNKVDTNDAAMFATLRLTRATDSMCDGDWTKKILEGSEKAEDLKKQVICFGAKSKAGGSRADVGGPLVSGSQKTVIGLGSFIYGPGGEYAYYQRVSSHVSWIEENIGAKIQTRAGAVSTMVSNTFGWLFVMVLVVNVLALNYKG